MNRPLVTPLLQALNDPASTGKWAPAEWTELLRQARASGLLGRIAHRVGELGPEAGQALPSGVSGHFESSVRLCRAQQGEIHREAQFLRQALKDLGAPVVVLKGAAYVLAGLPAAQGRLFSDIDIMVPKAALPRAESLLQLHGWMGTHSNAYDQRYYRQWMHELPPMEHVHRHTVLDVHHTILPETSRLRPDAARLFQHALALPNQPGLHMLSPADMVLHSMTHLFMNDELSHALRDLSDIDALLRHFGSQASFWANLAEHARQHQLQRILFYGTRYTSALFATPIPAAFQAQIDTAGPRGLARRWMDRLWLSALAPASGSSDRPLMDRAAHGALYLHGHWLRMPPALLLRHLTIKSLRLHQTAPPANGKPLG